MIKLYIYIYLFSPKFGHPRTLQLSIIIIASRPVSFLGCKVWRLLRTYSCRRRHRLLATGCINEVYPPHVVRHALILISGKKKSLYAREELLCALALRVICTSDFRPERFIVWGCREDLLRTRPHRAGHKRPVISDRAVSVAV